MYTKIFFLVYIFAGFAGGLAILMAVLLIKYWSSGNKRLLAAIRNFMICTALIDALYFYFDYDMLINGDYGTNALCRVLDICLFIGQVYFWTAYVRIKTMKTAESLKRLEKATRVVIGICVVLGSSRLRLYDERLLSGSRGTWTYSGRDHRSSADGDAHIYKSVEREICAFRNNTEKMQEIYHMHHGHAGRERSMERDPCYINTER